MDVATLISLLGGVAFAVAAVFAYARLRFGTRAAGSILLWAAVVGVLLDMGYLVAALYARGPVEVLRGSDEAAQLLALLLALAGISICRTPTLQGLEGFLFVFAAVMQFVAVGIGHPPARSPSYHPWFVSHGLAFAVSGACFVAAGCAGVAYRIVYHLLRRKRGTNLAGRVPPLEALERFGRWMLTIGFPIYSYGMLTGACGLAHRKDLQESAWYLDPSFLLSMGVWLIYGYGLWALVFRPQLRGPKAAALSSLAMVLVVAALLSQQLVSPIHR